MSDIEGSIRRWPAKPPSSVLDYTLDLTSWLARVHGETLTGFTLVSVVPTDLTCSTPDITASPLCVVWLTGGTHGAEYALTFHATTATRSDTFVCIIAVLDPTLTAIDRIGQGMALPGNLVLNPASVVQGPPGPPGPAGPQGPPGMVISGGQAGGASSFTYTQSSAAAVWTIVHNLGVFPTVVVTDSAGSLIEGDVHYNDGTTCVLTFSAAFAGTAHLV